jgi:hypothetical protein
VARRFIDTDGSPDDKQNQPGRKYVQKRRKALMVTLKAGEHLPVLGVTAGIVSFI